MTGCVESRRASALSGDALRHAMGQFATGITVVTSCDGAGAPVGTTANAVTSLSLQPPLLLVCLDRTSLTLEALRAHGAFAVNVLGERHRDVSAAFARRGSNGAWTGVRHRPCSTACPGLVDALATIDCKLEHIYPGGDHEIVVGRGVEIHVHGSAEAPLVFHRGEYATVQRLA